MTKETDRGSSICSPVARGQAGALLVELMIAITLLAVGALGFVSANQSCFKASRNLAGRDRVSAAFLSTVETLQDATFSSLHGTYDNTYMTLPTSLYNDSSSARVGELLGTDGNPVQVLITFDVDETNLPSEYGPILDLDGDNALDTNDVSGDYDVLPCRLSMTYQTSAGAETKNLYLILIE